MVGGWRGRPEPPDRISFGSRGGLLVRRVAPCPRPQAFYITQYESRAATAPCSAAGASSPAAAGVRGAAAAASAERSASSAQAPIRRRRRSCAATQRRP